jgi:Raf kinase inhibitor-like YbhB/YbcL family protein
MVDGVNYALGGRGRCAVGHALPHSRHALSHVALRTRQDPAMTMHIHSPAFVADARIPDQFTRDDMNLSPRVEWDGAPLKTRSFALVVEDPDAPRGTFRHWAAYDIPADAHALVEGAGSGVGAAPAMGRNDFGNAQYDGPQPPKGHGVHHYRFRLFALDVPELDVPKGASASQVLDAAQEHAIAEAETVGTFER